MMDANNAKLSESPLKRNIPQCNSERQDTAEQHQYLTFLLDSEILAIGILSIKEIIEYQNVTPVPMIPEYIRGVINLRGAVVPVMDLQLRFGRPVSEVTKRTGIIIVEIRTAEERQVVGVIVDAVDEVLDIAPADIEPPPALGTKIRTDFILGMAKVRGSFVVLLDVDRMFDSQDKDVAHHTDNTLAHEI
jgi:purine-binding chemotaxis protein CheW